MVREQKCACRARPYGILAVNNCPKALKTSVMDFTIPRHVEVIARRVRQFVDEEVIPIEAQLLRAGQDLSVEMLQALRAKAKSAQLWAPTMPKEWGGMGLDIQEIVPVFEEAGRSLLGPMAIHCAAPDEGNMHLLRHWANQEADRALPGAAGPR